MDKNQIYSALSASSASGSLGKSAKTWSSGSMWNPVPVGLDNFVIAVCSWVCLYFSGFLKADLFLRGVRYLNKKNIFCIKFSNHV